MTEKQNEFTNINMNLDRSPHHHHHQMNTGDDQSGITSAPSSNYYPGMASGNDPRSMNYQYGMPSRPGSYTPTNAGYYSPSHPAQQQQQQQSVFYPPPPQYQAMQYRQNQQPFQPPMAPINYYQPQQPQLSPRIQPNPSEFSDELDPFIVDVLKKPQERIFLLKLEKDLRAFIGNPNEQRLDLPQMNSYQRMMVHKVAPYFKLNRAYDPARKSLVLCKNQLTAIPKASFAMLVEPSDEPKEEAAPKIMIMRRANADGSNSAGGSRRGSPTQARNRQNMTYEERKAAYEEARARIFKDLDPNSTLLSDTEPGRE